MTPTGGGADHDLAPDDLRGRPVEGGDRQRFLARYGHLFEHSPWVVERAWALGPFTDAAALHEGFVAVLNDAAPQERLALVRAHPELADKVAMAAGLTESSAAEQAGAGLDRLTPEDYDAFHALNRAYRERFGFPFVICVKLNGKDAILAAMRRRLERSPAAELDEALAQIALISRFRLADLATAEEARRLNELSRRVRDDLQTLDPAADWVRRRAGPLGEDVLDVAIVGAGQSGLGAAFALRQLGVRNVLVLDENDEGFEGPWLTYARMITLRTPKGLTGIDLGLPRLTFRAYWEARRGADAWAALDKIPRAEWMAYLRWYRRTLDLPVRNRARVSRIEPAQDGLHRLTIGDGEETLLARKVVLATGIQGGGEWRTPDFVRENVTPRRYAHTSQPIDFAALKGKRIGLLGGGASAFDNAQHALGLGAGEAHLFLRRSQMPRVNPIRHMEISGLIRNFPMLDDARKYRVIDHFLTHSQPPTNDTFGRAAAYPGFHLHLGAPWTALAETQDGVEVTTPAGVFLFDFLILSTGLVTDLSLRPELAAVADDVLLWRDRYRPPAGEANPLLDLHPYLGPGFELQGRTPQGTRRLHGLFAFNYSALASLGLSASALSGLKTALPRLAAGISGQLFLDDQDALLDDFLNYREPEFLGQWPAN